MKSIDKKTLILIGVLLAIAVVVIAVSQARLDKSGGGKFGSLDAQTTTVVETQESTGTSAKSETVTEAPLQETTETTTEHGSDADTDKTTAPTVKHTVYNSYSLENSTLAINDDNTYELSSSNTDARFTGNIRNVSCGKDVPVKNSKLKKLGVDVKSIDENNLFYVQLEYDKHEFVKDGQTYVCYFNKNAHLKKTSFNVLVYYDETGTPTVYDLNGDITNTDFNNFYF